MGAPTARQDGGARPPRLLPTAVPTRGVLLVGVGAAATLGGLALAVHVGWAPLVRLDASLHAWAVGARSGGSIALARGLSFVGAGRVALPALLVVGALAPRGPRPWPTRLGAGAMLAGLAALGGAVEVLLNRTLDRVRPPVADWAGAAVGGSFPSGHTTTATLFAAGCAWALLGRIASRRGRWALVAAGIAFALGVGWSRVWLGVHWPSDVLGGWAYALAWSTLTAAAALFIARTRPGREALHEVDEADAQAIAADHGGAGARPGPAMAPPTGATRPRGGAR